MTMTEERTVTGCVSVDKGKVAVLGCGPAGMLAAHAAVSLGCEVTIFSVKAPSQIGGAQFLHRDIPGLTTRNPDGTISIEYLGTREGYATKIYGNPEAPVSWDNYVGRHHSIWNMQEAYREAWIRYNSLVVDTKVTPEFLDSITRGGMFDSVFSCIPRSTICINRLHRFEHQDVWITDWADIRDMTIIYNGDRSYRWYRSSRIFGHAGTEFPGGKQPEKQRCVKIKKPLSTDCDCWSNVTVPLGRYGQWKKEVLIHHAYEGVMNVISHP